MNNSVYIDYSQTPFGINFSEIFNVASYLVDRHIEAGMGDRIIIRTMKGEDISFRELYENVNRLGNALKDRGLEKGGRILIVVKDCPEFFYAFLGSIKGGYIPVPVNTILRAKDYSFFLEDSSCSALIYSSEFSPELEPAINESAHKPAFTLCLDDDGAAFRSFTRGHGAELLPAAAKEGDDCFILYSSGSTGNPKGAVHSHRDMIITSQRSGVEIFGINKDTVNFSAARLFFAYGLGNSLSFPLYTGGAVVLDDRRPTPETVNETMGMFKPTHFFGVPTLYARMLNELELDKVNLSFLKICTSAGEALPPELFKRWKDLTGIEILDGIGSTENLHSFISNRPGDVKPGSSGRLLPDYYSRIVDEKGRDVPQGESGQLLIKSRSAANRYWNNPERTAETMRDGWLQTGDTYLLDKDGYFFYCGRNDDMMKVGGIWCSPFEIESRLFEHPKVLEAAVIGHADENGLVKPMAFVVLKDQRDNNPETGEDLRSFCKTGLAPYKYPRWFRFVDELPKTATGKIQRFRLRDFVKGSM